MTKNQEPIIKIRGISKSYSIRHKNKPNTHPTVKDAFVKVVRKPLQLLGAAGGMHRERFWALKDINLDIMPGEVVALMGINGSGKSTLLKILARITQPESGEAFLKGKMSSMLEVGTGFHPELTGRENIYFNGSILGMSKTEIDEKFNDIIHFSEVEDFLDTPVKHFSSGMRVRLAFSIAAHLEPDILLIDEVLAVGDVRFKERSLDRMKKVAESGTTIVFVSHVVSQIREICTRGVVIDKGKVVYDGNLEDGLETYLKLNMLQETKNEETEKNDETEKNIVLGLSAQNVSVTRGKLYPSLKFNLRVNNYDEGSLEDLLLECNLINSDKMPIARMSSERLKGGFNLDKGGHAIVEFSVDQLNLLPGEYSINCSVTPRFNKNLLYGRNNALAPVIIPNYKAHGHSFKTSISTNTPSVVLDYDLKRIE